jgi:hypothetical protein
MIHRTLITLAILHYLAWGMVAHAQNLTISQIQTASVHFMTCAAGDSNPNRRYSWSIDTAGWGTVSPNAGLVGQAYTVVTTTPCRKIWLHNPWGRDPANDDMGLEQRPDLLEDGRTNANLTTVDRTFIAKWEPFVRGDYTSGVQCELHIYLGTVVGSSTMATITADPQRWASKWNMSLARVYQLGTRYPGKIFVHFDSCHDIPDTNPAYPAMLQLKRLGIPVGIEIRPRAVRTHLHVFNAVDMWDETAVGSGVLWNPYDPEQNLSSPGATNAQILGTRYAILTSTYNALLTRARLTTIINAPASNVVVCDVREVKE